MRRGAVAGMVAPESGWSVEGVPHAKNYQTIPSRKEAWTFRLPSWSSWSSIGMKATPPSRFRR